MPIRQEELSELDKDLLLKVIAHHLQPEMRRIVMLEVPLAYNRWMGAEIMAVHLLEACRPPPAR